MPVGYVFEDDHRAEPGEVEPPAPAEASAPGEIARAQPDPAGDGGAQPGPGEVVDADDAHQAQGEAPVSTAGGPEPVMAKKKGAEKPITEVKTDADPGVAPGGSRRSKQG